MKKTFTFLLGMLGAFAVRAQQGTYNYYYGNLHAHSSYSDGNQDHATSGHVTPFQNFVYASGSLNFDFLGISEHNHSQAGMQLANYAKGLRQADSATVNGQFVALYGMEWGVISGGGHMLVYGVNDLIGWETGNYNVYVPKSNYQNLYKEINKRPGAFALLAHPQTGDYNNLATAAFNLVADSALVGTPMRSGPATSVNTTYLNPSTSSYESVYRTLLARGYHVGISLDHDNHKTTFGRTTPGRLVVMAPALTKADLMQALRARRFYASDDWNTQVNFTLNNEPVGSIFQGGSQANISVNVTDADNETVRSITLMKGTPGSGQNAVSVASTNSGVSALSYVDNAASGSAYYYAVIIQNDGDRIVTSPIWYTRGAVTGEKPVQEEETAFRVYPNPVGQAEVTLSYFLKEQAPVRLEVLDALGREIMVVADEEKQTAGSHAYQLQSQHFKAGVYTIRLIRNGLASYRKLIVTH
ncbi:CehA/McbA family metallohydrolase [Adhaeribacter soli]|uniref:T9SS type A sorting domain-containing protein n=1 Tax=Adhaeribacter soli TaxID=2607655 RepID=A0A5N1IH37_9BACT|nr:CehA/McbA family metallohydrolase [Adhaeribacter soli]KAA9324973.1 T9SS type A sorting domain-containing protein [Adhaeribacter soli]